jgi:hypothetical protein
MRAGGQMCQLPFGIALGDNYAINNYNRQVAAQCPELQFLFIFIKLDDQN